MAKFLTKAMIEISFEVGCKNKLNDDWGPASTQDIPTLAATKEIKVL